MRTLLWDRHFRWSSKPREGPPVCSAKAVPSFLSCFRILNIGLIRKLDPRPPSLPALPTDLVQPRLVVFGAYIPIKCCHVKKYGSTLYIKYYIVGFHLFWCLSSGEVQQVYNMAAAHVVNGSSGPWRILLYIGFLLGASFLGKYYCGGFFIHKLHGSCGSFTPAIVRPCDKIAASSLPNCPYFIHDERYKVLPS